MEENKKSPSSGGTYSAEEITWYEGRIAVIRGLISYHERMVLPLKNCGQINCDKEDCAAVQFENDVYLDALKEALRLMEREISSF